MRYWRREEDGSYFVMYQSIEHPECRVRHNYVRATVLGGGFVIAPQKVPSGAIRSHVTYVLRYDPGGWSRIYHQLGMDVDLVMPMLRSVVGIRDEMSGVDFITPNVTVDSAASETAISDEQGAGGKDGSGAADGTIRTSVDASGLVTGVTRFKTGLPDKMWAEPDASLFQVRGTNYLTDKKKVPSATSKFHLVGVDLLSFESASDRYNISARSDSVGRTSSKFSFVINMIIPGPENICMVFYFHPAKDNIFEDGSPFSELLNDFIDGDDAFRNSRFKLIPTVVEGSFIIKQSVGSKPTLLGNKLKCPYHKGDNYFEVDIDISSNSVANTVVGMVQGVTKSLVVDMAFLLESQSEEELPENLLGAVRLQNVSLDKPTRVPRAQ
uniref:START domain-containing protein n=1 Tax=Globisporangium ultimum (strain ATCC 200006 / CBS 805.95 / DAOM BR144) TaxID=431595 RepID=K3W586_GLOUD